MKFLVIFAAVAAASASGNVFVDKAVYLNTTAPKELQRLAVYRTEHSKLTTQQNEYLSQVESLIENFETDKAEDIEASCNKVFDKPECDNILGRHVSDSSVPPEISGRGVPCSCSYLSDLCSTDTQYCLRGASGCSFSGGCGVLYFYQCNGICVPYGCVEC